MERVQLDFIVDNDGNKTAVIIPIEKWEKLNHELLSSWQRDLVGEFSKNDDFINFVNSFPLEIRMLVHIENTVYLLSKMKYYSKTQWIDIYDKSYKYFECLSQEDIQILYFFRKMLYLPENNQLIQNHIDFLAKHYKFSTYLGERVTIEDYKTLIKKSDTLNEISLLQYFLVHFKVYIKDFNITRLQRKAERDRLFIYDSIKFLEDIIKITELTSEDILTNNTLQMGKKDIIDNIAKTLYNGNKSQVYRANQEAQARIEHL